MKTTHATRGILLPFYRSARRAANRAPAILALLGIGAACGYRDSSMGGAYRDLSVSAQYTGLKGKYESGEKVPVKVSVTNTNDQPVSVNLDSTSMLNAASNMVESDRPVTQDAPTILQPGEERSIDTHVAYQIPPSGIPNTTSCKLEGQLEVDTTDGSEMKIAVPLSSEPFTVVTQ